MNASSDGSPAATLRDAYKVAGFRVRARIDAYDELAHPAFVLTLDRRSKKRCARDAARRAAVVMASGGGESAISIAAIMKSIWTSRCTG